MFRVSSRFIFIAFLLISALFYAGPANAQYYTNINTGTAGNISGNYALLSGSVNPNGYQTTVWFEYGLNNSFGYSTEHKSIGNGTTPVNFAHSLANLSPSTIYSFRVAVQSDCYSYQNNNYYNNYNYQNYYQNNNYCGGYSGQGGIQYGQTQTFTTTSDYSGGTGVETTVATQTAQRSTAMHGTVRPNNSDTTVWFEYGKTNSLGQISPSKIISAINNSTNVNFYAYGLEPSTTYYYRMVGQNTMGRINGAVLAFTTIATITPAPNPVPAPIPGPIPAPTPTSTDNVDLNQPLLTLNVKVESSEPSAGDELNYTATITNKSDKAVRNVSLAVNLPAEIKFIDGGQSPVLDGNTVKVAFAEIEKDGKRVIPLRFKVQDSAEKGASLPIGSFLAYTSAQNRQLGASANATILVKNGAELSAGTTAVLSENLPAFFWLKWVLWVLVILLVALLIYIAYRFLRSWLAMH